MPYVCNSSYAVLLINYNQSMFTRTRMYGTCHRGFMIITTFTRMLFATGVYDTCQLYLLRKMARQLCTTECGCACTPVYIGRVGRLHQYVLGAALSRCCRKWSLHGHSVADYGSRMHDRTQGSGIWVRTCSLADTTQRFLRAGTRVHRCVQGP